MPALNDVYVSLDCLSFQIAFMMLEVQALPVRS